MTKVQHERESFDSLSLDNSRKSYSDLSCRLYSKTAQFFGAPLVPLCQKHQCVYLCLYRELKNI